MKLIRRTDLNIEDIRSEDYWNRFRIFSMLNTEKFNNKLEINALVDLCLHRRASTLTVCKSFYSTPGNKKPIRENYDLSTRTYIVDNLPIFTYLKIANEFTESSIKLQDLKFIDRDTTFFVRIPKEVSTNIEIRKKYEKIQLKSIGNYRKLYLSKITNSKEYASLLLPLGVQSRAMLSLNVEKNIELVNMLLCSDSVVENQLGDMLEMVLKSDIKISPDSKRRAIFAEVLEYLRDLVSEDQHFDENSSDTFQFRYVEDIVENLISNFERLINPLGSKEELEFDYNDQVHIGKLLSKVKLGNIASSKGSVLSGYLPLSEIIKLQNNKFTMYIPFLSDLIDIDKELDRANSKCYKLPRELEKNQEIKKEIKRNLSDIYNDIREWREESKQYMSEEISKEFTRYLLPISHMTMFNLYLDINDIFDIRDKDLEYIDEWIKLFYQRDPLFKK
jgi:hypothetical protein